MTTRPRHCVAAKAESAAWATCLRLGPQPITTAVPAMTRTTLPGWRKVVVRSDDLPATALPHPGISEPISPSERSLGPAAADDQPSRHDRRASEVMDLHVLVVRCRHGVRTGRDIVQDGVPSDRAIVLGVNESFREQPLKHTDITSGQRDGPIILQSKEHPSRGIRHLGVEAGSLAGDQRDNEEQSHFEERAVGHDNEAMIFLYSASLKAFKVSLRRFPCALMPRTTRAAVVSSGSSAMATPSYWPIVR